MKLFGFIFLTHIGLDHTDAAHVFLHDRVHLVVDLEHTLEDRPDKLHQQAHAHRQNRKHAQENQRQLAVDLKRHDQREHQHDRTAHRDARTHLERVLHIGHVGRQAGDDRAGRKLIDVGKGKILHRIIHVVPQVAGEAGGGARRIGACRRAEHQRQRRARHEDGSVFPDLSHILRINALINQKRHYCGDNDLHHNLEHHKKRREQRILFELAHAL